MKFHSLIFVPLICLLFAGCRTNQNDQQIQILVEGLLQPVELIRDSFGINHIYAQNQHDLFYAQGYCAAKDRLFQFEIWRRQATGTVAEILGERELKRDIGTRLFMYRGDLDTELNYYHQDGKEIIEAFTDGVNAYIAEVRKNPDLRPITLKALDIMPQKWTPADVISRHQGLLGNIGTELETGRAVANLGEELTHQYNNFHPKKPNLKLDPSITAEMLEEDILELYNAYRQSVKFRPEDILPKYRSEDGTDIGWTPTEFQSETDMRWIGSNNWVTRPSLSKDGHGYMANDPHRRLAIPSLRYWAHLHAPGWNVIGGGEPEIPGISIGHNEHGAWGLTVFRTDGEDLYVYDLNPENLEEYRYQGAWEKMNVIYETVKVKDSDDVKVQLNYTHHGPVTFIDTARLKAYAVKCAWMEPGGSPYLASLRMDQAKTWEEFRAACNYSHIPGENMIWADREGNIGWQAVGIAPVRRNFSGLVPVPGDGRFEWDGYLPIVEKPNVYNPPAGYFATANQNVTPEEYTEWDAIGYSWSDPFRGQRIAEVMNSGEKFGMDEMRALQNDYKSVVATQLVPLLADIETEEVMITEVQAGFEDWDKVLAPDSWQAAVYVAWENELRSHFYDYFPNDRVQQYIPSISMTRILEWILNPTELGTGDEEKRDLFLIGTMASALKKMQEKNGNSSLYEWKYGGEQNKHVKITHPLGRVVNAELQKQLNTIALPRGGNQYTPGATGSSMNQTHGATFKIIVDVHDWDASIGMNSPGQSGDPASPFYKNLYRQWGSDGYFPVCFSKEMVEKFAAERFAFMVKN